MKFIKWFNLIVCVVVVLCSSCEKKDATTPPLLEIAENDHTINFPEEESVSSINFKTNVEDWSVESDQDWCIATVLNVSPAILHINVFENQGLDIRSAVVTIKADGLSEKINVAQLGVRPAILFDTKSKRINFVAQTFAIDVTTNIELGVIFSEPWITLHPNLKSERVEMVDYTFEFDVEALPEPEEERFGKIYFKQKEGELTDSVLVNQYLVPSEDYELGLTSDFEKDKKLEIISAALTPSDKYQAYEGISNSIDGDLETLYHSPWSGMPNKPLLSLEYTFVKNQPLLITLYCILVLRVLMALLKTLVYGSR